MRWSSDVQTSPSPINPRQTCRQEDLGVIAATFLNKMSHFKGIIVATEPDESSPLEQRQATQFKMAKMWVRGGENG